MNRRDFIGLIGCSCCGLILPACSTTPVTERRQFKIYPETFINAQAENMYKGLVRRSKLSTNQKQLDEITEIGNKMVESIGIYFQNVNKPNPTDNFKWEYNLIESKMVNAFCLPGGKIGVFTGILEFTKTKDGMALLMGHEIAHAVAKHGVERMSRAIAVELGFGVADVFTGGVAGKTRQMIGESTGLDILDLTLMRPHGRTQESEADYMGLIFSSLAGYDLNESVRLWKRMNKKNKKKEPPQFLSTHPSSKNRIIKLRGWIPEVYKKYPKIANL
jgi:predicted Zn-dependent protease|tara:strand:+ start:2127 stop:2951 length:825 start_codon:yes stop_codon:yes gene_type:complete